MTLPVADAVAQAAAIRDGACSALDVVEEALGRLAEIEETVHPCTVVLADEARAAARTADSQRAAGAPLGPLHGVPFAVKDPIWVRGAPATMGSRAYADFLAPADAVAVRRLRDAGAIVVAKTIAPEFGWPPYCGTELHGLTRNPWSLDRTPGASSGGSGAAVAAGAVPLALGSDALGSIRIPSAYCGVAGLKPTTGVVPDAPGFPNYHTTNAVGPMAGSVRDLALALRLMAGYDHAAPFGPHCKPIGSTQAAPLDGLRIAWSEDLGFATVSEPVRACLRTVVESLEACGAELTRAHPDAPDHLPIVAVLSLAEIGPAPPLPDLVDHPSVRAMLDAGASLSAARLVEAQIARTRFATAWQRFFDDYDVLLTPTMGTAAFAADPHGLVTVDGLTFDVDRDPWYELAIPANLAGQPALSVPMGHDGDGMPLGLQIQAARFDEERCLRVAAAVERMRPWRLAGSPSEATSAPLRGAGSDGGPTTDWDGTFAPSAGRPAS